MDPLSILALVEACAGLAVTAGKLAIGLKSLADNYKKASLTFRALSSQCKLCSTAVRAIQGWLEGAPEVTTIDDRIWEQLADSLACANDAIHALETELVSRSRSSVNTFWKKAGVVWNLQTMRELEDCIHKQISSLSVMLQIMNLPTRKSQTNKLTETIAIFQDSRSSAMSVRDPETSTLRAGGDGPSTMRAPSTIMTTLSQLPRFDFDEMLLASQVYRRNRNKTLAINAKQSGNGKTKDAETSVSEWDLSPKKVLVDGKEYLGDHGFDLKEAAQYIDRGNAAELKAYIEGSLLTHHRSLQDKYTKVKRYYFDIEAQVKELRDEISVLQGSYPDEPVGFLLQRGNLDEPIEFLLQIDLDRREYLDFVKYTEQQPAEGAEGLNVFLCVGPMNADVAKLIDHLDGYKLKHDHWQLNNPSGASVLSRSTAYSAGPQQSVPI